MRASTRALLCLALVVSTALHLDAQDLLNGDFERVAFDDGLLFVARSNAARSLVPPVANSPR